MITIFRLSSIGHLLIPNLTESETIFWRHDIFLAQYLSIALFYKPEKHLPERGICARCIFHKVAGLFYGYNELDNFYYFTRINDVFEDIKKTGAIGKQLEYNW